MKPADAFEVGLRLLGLFAIITGLTQMSARVSFLFLDPGVSGAGFTQEAKLTLVILAAQILLGLFLLFGGRIAASIIYGKKSD